MPKKFLRPASLVRVKLATCFCLLICPAASATAQQLPAWSPRKTVTVICPWSPGGGTDRVSRFWADALQREFGKPFVVVNRTGGAGAVGHFAGAHAPPDGHTLCTITFELCTMHRMRISKLTYRDYACLLQMNADPAALIVNTDAPWQSLGEWLDDVRARPGELRMSGTATGGAWDLARAGLLVEAGLSVDSIVWVPHPGAAPSLVELMGGHLDAVCCSVPEVAAQLKGGQVRVLAVMSDERLEEFPDIPTAGEQGVDWTAVGWRGLALPKGTPPDVIAMLEATCRKIAESQEYREFMRKNGFGITIRGPDEFTEFLRAQDEQWKAVVEAAEYDKGLTGNNDPGPLALPGVLMVLLLAGCAVIVVRKRRGLERGLAPLHEEPPHEEPPHDEAGSTAPEGGQLRGGGAVAVWLLVAALVIYVSAIPWLGFALSTLLFATVMVCWLGGRWWSAVLAALVIVLVICVLFVGVFRVQLPAGIFGLPF